MRGQRLGALAALACLLCGNPYAEERTISNDIVVTSYTPVVMAQGQSRVFPVFRIRNAGDREYREVELRYNEPEGLTDTGETVRLNRYQGDSWSHWRRVTLAAGQEVPFNPSDENDVYLSARTDQAQVVYGTTYEFRFEDDQGHGYRTPWQGIDEFAYVAAEDVDISPRVYSNVPRIHGAVISDSRFAALQSRLDEEINRLETVVHPKQLEELKRIRDEWLGFPALGDATVEQQDSVLIIGSARPVGSLLGTVGNLIEARTGSSLAHQYRSGTKWLALFGVESLGIIEMTLYVDLADYLGITAEGRGDGANQGEQWVTVWVDGAAGLAISLVPISFGVVKLPFNAGAADPERRYHLSLGKGSLPGFSVTAIERRAGNDRPEWGEVSFGVLDASLA